MSELDVQKIQEIIDIDKTRVKPFNGFIFLCGGPADITRPQPISLRDAIQRELAKCDNLCSRVKVAEDYKNWATDSIYGDLVAFESHLAELSSVIVLALESPGAIAELGLFSALEEFQEKLLIFVDNAHYQADSFIRLGPIQYLENRFQNNAHCHRFLVNGRAFDASAAEELQSEMVQAITDRITAGGSEQAFDKDRWLHKALLLCDILNVYSALTIRELRDKLRALGLDLSEVELRQILYLLEQVDLLRMVPSGTQRFYVTLSSEDYLIHGAGNRIDFDRLRIDVIADYRLRDKKRFRAIQEVRRGALQ
jgi:hypothetical protein